MQDYINHILAKCQGRTLETIQRYLSIKYHIKMDITAIKNRQQNLNPKNK